MKQTIVRQDPNDYLTGNGEWGNYSANIDVK